MAHDKSERPPDRRETLPRVLGPTVALCAVVGSVIGSGIFIVPASVASSIPSIGPIILAWVFGGLFSLAGALTLAELAAMLPQAGGPYVYLREAYGRLPAFLFGWVEFLVIRAGASATLAAAFAMYFAQLAPAPGSLSPPIWQAGLAVGALALVAVVNIAGTRIGGGVQVVGTLLKVGALVALILLPFLLGEARAANLEPVWPRSFDRGLLNGFMAAMVGILWTYDGWYTTAALAEEIRDPGRNIPWAMGLGVLTLISLYLGATLAYHLVLPIPEIASAAMQGGSPRVVAAVYSETLLGAPGLVAISLVVMTSTLISLNGNILSGPRAYFAMARDGLFPHALCRVHPRFRTPANAILAQAVWSITLMIVGTWLIVTPPPSTGLPDFATSAWETLRTTPLYDVLLSYVIFGATSVYLLAILAVFVLRHRHPEWHRPYRTWGYPVTPLLYVAASILLLHSMFNSRPIESLSGLVVLGLSVPAYFVFSRNAAPPDSSPVNPEDPRA